MDKKNRWARRRSIALHTVAAGLIVFLLAGIASGQLENGSGNARADWPEAEFQLARMIYRTVGGAGSHGIYNPWWKVDAPFAEEHFLPSLRRVTTVSVSDNTREFALMDDRLFDYPFLWLQQPGNGNWRPTNEEAARLREYLMRGGFLMVDDFHGEYEWAPFEAAIQRVLPGRPIIEIPENDPVLHDFYDLHDRLQIPGVRHLRMTRGGQIVTRMEGPPHWRGIYDDRGRLIVAINFNMDIGDAWEHADDAYYPMAMTAQAYRLGVNYVIYAMTH